VTKSGETHFIFTILQSSNFKHVYLNNTEQSASRFFEAPRYTTWRLRVVKALCKNIPYITVYKLRRTNQKIALISPTINSHNAPIHKIILIRMLPINKSNTLHFSNLQSISGAPSPSASSYTHYSNATPDSSDAQHNYILTMANTNNDFLPHLKLTVSYIHFVVCLTTGPKSLPN
jgi:hypothetical protein